MGRVSKEAGIAAGRVGEARLSVSSYRSSTSASETTYRGTRSRGVSN